MKQFTGKFSHALDAKNRVSVPRKVLEVLRQLEGGGDEVVVTLGFDGCLLLFSPCEFARISSQITDGSLGEASVRQLSRTWFSRAEHCPIDKNGRMLLPKVLKDRIGLSDKVVFAAAGSRVELWHPDVWDLREAEDLAAYEAHASEVLR